ncbi:hypothetical protein M7I_2019 [Glarea lozoyensis 74030]|uniref:Uncharacterized protein n=1 Tax=Glarea lozoyensis (strain ATCC 74030 / MF5533) TaxID=1104152 RepID=H0EHN5_GLAL7|nr:hypothetical protein M7I_2019 [Glarea lozoyensis 74030]
MLTRSNAVRMHLVAAIGAPLKRYPYSVPRHLGKSASIRLAWLAKPIFHESFVSTTK